MVLLPSNWFGQLCLVVEHSQDHHEPQLYARLSVSVVIRLTLAHSVFNYLC